ncbi:MAG: S46 family peptidase [Chlorobi bacterium]|nr:S46 family peptidase [Chlorobiota bacterium]
MKRFYTLLISIALLLTSTVKADEGMWLPALINQLNIGTMTEMGLELTADDIYSLNHSSLKDAIVALDYGSCTAELVSAKGLLLTNHHCGYGEIQEHSSTEHDYLSDGFWAMSMDEELSNPGKTATFLIRMEDVTERIISQLSDTLTEMERWKKIDEISQTISKEVSDSIYDARVESLFKANKFYLFVYETFRDIRLVGAPPSDIGKFGGDVDNWMWPRHTGDFSIFRIYTGPDGNPADYSEDNIPLVPKHFLPVSTDGVTEGDFTMILGYPGSTSRYLTSYGVKEVLDVKNPARIKIRTKKLELMKEGMDESDKVRIQYASKYSRSSNYWKYSIGQNKGLKRLKVYEQKQATEQEFMDWANQNEDRKAKYGDALNLIKKSYEQNAKANKAMSYFYEAVFGGGEILPISNRAMNLYRTMKSTPDDTEKINGIVDKLRKRMDNFYKDYNVPIDKKITAALLKIYHDDIAKEYQPDIYTLIEKKFKGDYNKYVNYMFAKSIFADKTKMDAFLNKPSTKTLDKDPAFKAMESFVKMYYIIYQETQELSYDKKKGERLFLAGLMEMNPDKAYYPDANSTMRLTYGTVCDYYPADAVHYNYYTTLKGVMEKDDPTSDDFFAVPDKLKEIYKNKDYGQYGEGDIMKVCFTTNNDITGGNSGSPVMNGKGELVGIAFDGNWEAMSGDIAFEPKLQRCINVDIRYVLLIIDKFAGCTRLIDEMNLVSHKNNETPANSKEPEKENALMN